MQQVQSLDRASSVASTEAQGYLWAWQPFCAEMPVERAPREPIFSNPKLNPDYARPDLAETLQDGNVRTDLQLELFALVPDSYDFIEKLLARLPRQRQREHFRKLYLREYKSVQDDGSIAFFAGNKQKRHANNWLRDTLGNRLKRVFAQYRCAGGFLLPFSENEPSYLGNLQQAIAAAEPHSAEEKALSERLQTNLARHHQRQLQKDLPFYLITESKLKEIAYKLACAFANQQRDFFLDIANRHRPAPYSQQELNQITEDCYALCGEACAQIGFPAPHWLAFQKFKEKERKAKEKAELGLGKRKIKPLKGELIDVALNKLVCEKYWLRTMRNVQKQMVEHIAIACGEVRKQASNYISRSALYAWSQQTKKNYDFLRNMIVENIDDPAEQQELFDMYLRSSSNPALRRNELMNQLRGIEEWGEENGHQALFLTLTAPSSFHATTHNGQSNKKWQGASPKATQAYLNQVWQKYRAILAKRGITLYGMRVAEPHHDGTPHWHLLVYVLKEFANEVATLFQQKALAQDGEEKGAKKHRCKVEYCDKEKGSATGYISKYISKNIDGFALDDEKSDENPEISLKDNAKRAKAWASLWRIRQFQFFGVAPITVWRELRRLVSGKLEDETLEKGRAVADVGCYASYLQVQGGAAAKRTDQPIRLDYEQTEANRYGEKRKKIQGIANRFNLTAVKTRLKKWTIKRKPADFNQNNERSEANLSARSAPRTCVSNCNALNRAKIRQNADRALISRSFPLNEYQFDAFLRKKYLVLDQYHRLELIGEEVVIREVDALPPLLAMSGAEHLQKLIKLRRH